MDGFFSVVPKTNCPHVDSLSIKELVVDVAAPCAKCQDKSENWLCLSCSKVLCSRFVKKHMLEHYEEEKHPIVFSYSDGSFFCYACKTDEGDQGCYIVSNKFAPIKKAFEISKFGDDN